MFEAMYAVMIRMKLIKYSTVGLLSLSLLLSHSVPIKAEMHKDLKVYFSKHQDHWIMML